MLFFCLGGLRVYFEIAALYKLENNKYRSYFHYSLYCRKFAKFGSLLSIDYKEAQKWLENSLQIKDSQNTFTVLVLLSIANVYQIQGDYQSAIDTITNSELIFLEDYIIFELAQNLMLQGRTGEAKAHLRNILKDFKGKRLENLVKEILKVI